MAQTVKNLPAVRETWVRSLGWDDPLKGIAPVFFPGESPRTEELWSRVAESDMTERLTLSLSVTEPGRACPMGGAYNHPKYSWQREHGLKRGNTMPIWGVSCLPSSMDWERNLHSLTGFQVWGLWNPHLHPSATLLFLAWGLCCLSAVGVGVCVSLCELGLVRHPRVTGSLSREAPPLSASRSPHAPPTLTHSNLPCSHPLVRCVFFPTRLHES